MKYKHRYDPPMRAGVVSRTTLRMYVRKNVTPKIRALTARVTKLERAVRKMK